MYQTSYLSLESFISKEFWDSNFIEIMKFDPYPHKINKYLVKWFLNLQVRPKNGQQSARQNVPAYLIYTYLSMQKLCFHRSSFLAFLFFPNKCSSGLCQHTKGIYLFIFSASEFTLKYIQIYNTVYIMYNICTQKVLKR